ncbi:MAG TPA: DUF4388 domain-containing protein [Longimicrobiales bacterium]
MAIEGPLRELGIQDVLQLLELARKTGVLELHTERRDDEAELHFDRGQIVFARRRKSQRRLGQQLLRSGKLTERELQRALELQRQDPSQRLAWILLEMGSVAREELERQLRFQIEEAVYEVMSWTDGQFRFEERESVVLGDPEVRVRVESLLMEGARRIDEWARLEAKIPSQESIPMLAASDGGDGAPLELHPEEWEVLAEIDGERDLRQIAAALGRSSFDVARIIYGLVSMGVVQVEERPSRLTDRELESAIAEARRLLEIGEAEAAGRLAGELQASFPDRAELAVLEGVALVAQGRVRAATEAFVRAVGLDPLSPEAHLRLGFTAARIGDFDRAGHALESYLRLAPSGERREAADQALSAVRLLSHILANGGD